MRNPSKKVLFKSQVNGMLGQYWLVVEVDAQDTMQDVKSVMYARISAVEKLVTGPTKTTKTFIKGAKNLFSIQPYYKIY